jgi:hypothetical protein
MMKQVILAIMLVSMLVIGIMPTAAQNNPDIVSFTTSANSVSREALRNRTALIPVTWAVVNRPQNANLYFEQVLPDGRLINVELPRDIPYVASTGDGIAAPTLPDGNLTSIRLRVTLKDTRNSTVYDTAEITLPITSDGGSTNPTITLFEAIPPGVMVNRTQLNAGQVQIPVRWTAINRPAIANLVFEQVLSDGRVVNVELPRNFVWVNSSDRGTVAPVLPGGNATSLTTVTYDERIITIPIGDQPTSDPAFLLFSPITPTIDRSIVAGGNARIGVLWSLANRPANTNLVFEQVLPNGTARNAELPRDFIVVPSSGNGIVTAVLPEGNINELVYRVRLVNMRTQATLLTAQMTVQMVDESTLQFTNFTASPTTVNDTQRDSAVIALTWITSTNVNVRIQAGNYVANFASGRNGSYNLPLAEVDFTGDMLNIVVTVTDSRNNTVTRTQTITITNTRPACEYQWEITVDTTDCAAASYTDTGAYQLFDRGFMVFDPTATQGMMVFYNDGTMAQYADNWGGRDYTIDGTPPVGQYAPERGFGYLWFSDIAVRSGLGWGVTPEVAHTVVRQSTLSGSASYITLPEGRVARFGGGRWQMVD